MEYMGCHFWTIFGPHHVALGVFLSFLVLELFALVQIVRGLWGELGADQLERYDRLMTNIAGREVQAAELIASGDQAGADAKLNIANNLRAAADLTLDAATPQTERPRWSCWLALC